MPLSKEVFSSFGNIPVHVNDLKRECQEKVIGTFGFKEVDYTLLNDDNLWYIRQMETEKATKDRWLSMLEPIIDGDSVPVYKQIF